MVLLADRAEDGEVFQQRWVWWCGKHVLQGIEEWFAGRAVGEEVCDPGEERADGVADDGFYGGEVVKECAPGHACTVCDGFCGEAFAAMFAQNVKCSVGELLSRLFFFKITSRRFERWEMGHTCTVVQFCTVVQLGGV